MHPLPLSLYFLFFNYEIIKKHLEAKLGKNVKRYPVYADESQRHNN